MKRLRDGFRDFMVLGGLAERTVESYLYAVRMLLKHCGKPPRRISEAEVGGYLVYLKDTKKAPKGTFSIAVAGNRKFFCEYLENEWRVFDIAKPLRENRLPVVLGRDEVTRLLSSVYVPVYRACLSTIYGCGLRLGEAITLTVPQVDGERSTLQIRGKGGKDRYVRLPDGVLEILREHWASHRSPTWLFPAPGRWSRPPAGDRPVSPSSVQRAFHRAREQAGIRKRASVHTLRHSYATHLLEAGVNLRVIQGYLGHRSVRTTQVYAHLTQEARAAAIDPINALMKDLPRIKS